MFTETPRPDVDARCSAAFHPSGVPTIFRLRAWFDDRLAVVSDMPANRGASVTNAIEHVAAIVEAHLDVVFAGDIWDGWQMVQEDRATGSLDMVRFAGRDGDMLRGPEWAPLPVSLFAWLYASVV